MTFSRAGSADTNLSGQAHLALADHAAAPASDREVHKRRMRWVRHALLSAVLAGALALTAITLRPEPVPVDVALVERGSLVVAIQETGRTRVKDRFAVSAPVTGMLSRLALEAGDPVHEGDLLAEIAPTLSPLLDARTGAQAQARLSAALSVLGQARAHRARALTAEQQAQRELERTRRLAAARTTSAQALEQAEFEVQLRHDELSSAEFAVKVAAEEVRGARAVLDTDAGGSKFSHHVNVLAPASGRVLRVEHESAGVVQAGTPLLEVGDPEALEIVIDLLTTDAVNVRPGTPARVSGWGGDRTLAARVVRVEPSGFTRPSALGVDEQRVNVILALSEPRQQWAALGDGFRVEARIVVWEGHSVLKVPNGAVFNYGDGWAAYLIENGRSRLTRVRVGHRNEAEAEIVDGLEAGAALAVHPGDRVIDGARVEAR